MTTIVTTIIVRDRVGTFGALEPTTGNSLGTEIVSLSKTSLNITLDFSGISAISSAFANALFVALNRARPLDDWRSILHFVGLGPKQADIIAGSLRAVRSEIAQGRSRTGR